MSNAISATSGAYSPSTSSTTARFDNLNTSSLSQTVSADSKASVSLAADLGSATSQTGAGQLTLAFAQALQQATSVDPTTGHREIISGANDQLTSALSALLVSNGFSSQQAASATADFAKQLSQSDQISVSASFDQLSGTSSTLNQAYSQQALSSVTAVSSNERSGSVLIGLDLDSGTLAVTLHQQDVIKATSTGEISGSGTLSAPIVTPLSLPSSTAASASGSATSLAPLLSSAAASSATTPDSSSDSSPLAESEVDSLSIDQRSLTVLINYSTVPINDPSSGGNGPNTTDANLASSANTAPTATTPAASSTDSASSADDQLSQLLDNLAKTSLHGAKGVLALLTQMAKTALQGNDPSSSSDKNAATDKSKAASGATSVVLQFSQTLSIQQLDGDGYGSTLYQRTDGSLAQISLQPTRTTA